MFFKNAVRIFLISAALLDAGGAWSETKQIQAQAPAQQQPPRAPAARAPAPAATSLAPSATPATPSAAAPQPSTESGPVSSQPQATTASFGDWVMRCRRIDNTPGSATSCEVAQTLQVQGQGPIAEIAFGSPPGKDSSVGMRVVVVLPNNVTFAGPVLMSIDEKDKPVELTYRRCLPAGCFADTDAKDDILARWRTQAGRGRLAFKDGASRDIVLPFSFRGLAQALDAMAKL
jgi:invasion protein IalB